MFKKLLRGCFILCCLVALNGMACGASFDNHKACTDWLAKASCGDFDFSKVVSCDAYKQVTTCDISEYFKCLTDNTKCNDVAGKKTPDTSGYATCASKAQCQ